MQKDNIINMENFMYGSIIDNSEVDGDNPEDMEIYKREWDKDNQLWRISKPVQTDIEYGDTIIIDCNGTLEEFNYKIFICGDIFCDFEDIHIEGDKDHLFRMRHDAKISNFQYTVVESKTDTLGGKFPFIRRNGDTNYRQFSFNGLITHFNQEEENKDEYFSDYITKYDSAPIEDNENFITILENKRNQFIIKDNPVMKYKYSDYCKDNKVNEYNDIFLEKNYRDEITEYFYENRVRLFRSATEGNILVKLMNITMTPNEQIDRRVYNIQCTAFEVDEYNLENCIKYGIWEDNMPDIFKNDSKVMTITKVGQLRYNEDKNENVQGILIKTNIYKDISDHLALAMNDSFISLERIIGLKASFWGPVSYYGVPKDKKYYKNSLSLILPSTSSIIKKISFKTGTKQVTINHKEISSQNNTKIESINKPDTYINLSRIYYNITSQKIKDKYKKSLGKYGIAREVHLQWLSEIAYQFLKKCVEGEDQTFLQLNNLDTYDETGAWSNEDKTRLFNIAMDAFENNFNRIYSTINGKQSLDTNINNIMYHLIYDCLSPYGLNQCSAIALNILRYNERLGEDSTDQILDSYPNGESREKIATQAMSRSILQYVKYYDKIEKDPFTGCLIDSTVLDEDLTNVIKLYIFIALIMALKGGLGFGRTLNSSQISNSNGESVSEIITQDIVEGLETKDYCFDMSKTNVGSIKDFVEGNILLAGYGLVINGQQIVVQPQMSYQLTDQDTDITSLINYRIKDESLHCLIDYIAQCTVLKDTFWQNKVISYQYYKIGQLRTNKITYIDDNNEQQKINYIYMIKNKYELDNPSNSLKRRFVGVYYLSIEAEPYTVFEIRDSSDAGPRIHVINETGILTLYDKNTYITSLHCIDRVGNENFDDDLNYIDGEGIENNAIMVNNEIVYSDTHFNSDFLINYGCLIREEKYI